MIKKMFIKYKEIVDYLFFGVLAMFISFFSYYIFARVFKIEQITSNVLSWICAVIFAYVTNKLFVFESKTETKKELIIEICGFFLARILSGIICDVGTFALMVKVFKINDIFSKLVTQVLVVTVNYLFSKLLIFKKRI